MVQLSHHPPVGADRTDCFPRRWHETGGHRLLLVFGETAGAPARPGKRRYDGATDFHRLLGDVPYERLSLGRRLPIRAGAADLSAYAGIVNMMTDPELHRPALDNLQRLLAGYRGKVINRPQAVLQSGRDTIAATLAGTSGLTVPKVARLPGGKPTVATKALERLGMALPLIVRRAGTHTGNIVGLIESGEALLPAIARPGDYFATEFVDCRGADGLFRKYRVFFFGDRIVFRHMIAFDQWSVHGGTRMQFMAGRAELMAEEERLCARAEGPFPPAWQAVFDEVRSRIALDFFGMDFGIDRDGRMVLFEVNATMNFYPPVVDPRFNYLRLPLPAGREAFRQLVAAEPAFG